MTYKNENRRLLAASDRCGINMDAVIRSPMVQVVYYKQRARGGFLICLEESELQRIISHPASRERLRNGSNGFDRVVLAEFSPDVNDRGDYSLLLALGGDRELEVFCHKAVNRFIGLVDVYGSWPSFGQFLAVEGHYDVDAYLPTRQIPLDYWCLVGDLTEGNEVHSVRCFGHDTGLYIDPETAEVPVFTSAIFADLAAQAILERRGLSLEPRHLPCLPCYLTGMHNDLPKGLTEGARLNGQWAIDCYSCAQSLTPGHGWVGHFYIQDDGRSFALCGCSDKKVPPVGWERRWDASGTLFSPPCGKTSWAVEGGYE